MPLYSVRYRIRYEEGKYIPERKTTLLFLPSPWQAWHYPYPCEEEEFYFTDVQQAIGFLEDQTGKPRNRLNIDYRL